MQTDFFCQRTYRSIRLPKCHPNEICSQRKIITSRGFPSEMPHTLTVLTAAMTGSAAAPGGPGTCCCGCCPCATAAGSHGAAALPVAAGGAAPATVGGATAVPVAIPAAGVPMGAGAAAGYGAGGAGLGAGTAAMPGAAGMGATYGTAAGAPMYSGGMGGAGVYGAGGAPGFNGVVTAVSALLATGSDAAGALLQKLRLKAEQEGLYPNSWMKVEAKFHVPKKNDGESTSGGETEDEGAEESTAYGSKISSGSDLDEVDRRASTSRLSSTLSSLSAAAWQLKKSSRHKQRRRLVPWCVVASNGTFRSMKNIHQSNQKRILNELSLSGSLSRAKDRSESYNGSEGVTENCPVISRSLSGSSISYSSPLAPYMHHLQHPYHGEYGDVHEEMADSVKFKRQPRGGPEYFGIGSSSGGSSPSTINCGRSGSSDVVCRSDVAQFR